MIGQTEILMLEQLLELAQQNIFAFIVVSTVAFVLALLTIVLFLVRSNSKQQASSNQTVSTILQFVSAVTETTSELKKTVLRIEESRIKNDETTAAFHAEVMKAQKLSAEAINELKGFMSPTLTRLEGYDTQFMKTIGDLQDSIRAMQTQLLPTTELQAGLLMVVQINSILTRIKEGLDKRDEQFELRIKMLEETLKEIQTALKALQNAT